MKKRILAIALTGIMAASMFAGCGGSDSSKSSDASAKSTSSSSGGTDNSSEHWTIGYANRDDTDTYLKQVEDEFVALAEADDSFDVVLADAAGDSQSQIDQLNNFAVQGVNCVVMVPQDGDTVVDFVDQFNADGVPVFCSSQAATSGDFYFVGASDYDMGYCIAEWAHDNLPENAKILYLGGVSGYQTSIDRRQALVDGLGDRIKTDFNGDTINEDGDIEVLSWQECDYTMEDGMRITEDWIQTFSDFDAIIACNDRSALGALEALQGAGITDVKVLGIDGLEDAMQAIKDGTMAATVLQSAKAQAQALYDAIVAVKAGEEVEKTINPDVITIDASNVDKYM